MNCVMYTNYDDNNISGSGLAPNSIFLRDKLYALAVIPFCGVPWKNSEV